MYDEQIIFKYRHLKFEINIFNTEEVIKWCCWICGKQSFMSNNHFEIVSISIQFGIWQDVFMKNIWKTFPNQFCRRKYG